MAPEWHHSHEFLFPFQLIQRNGDSEDYAHARPDSPAGIEMWLVTSAAEEFKAAEPDAT
jgi:hypothetical protein